MRPKWEEVEKERRRKIEEERIRYLAMSDYEASQLSYSEQYDRIRYLREAEAARWLEDERRKLPLVTQPDEPVKKRHFNRRPVIVYDRD